jgi:hypothetical protein
MDACCRDGANRERQPRDPARPGVTIDICRVCGKRHIRMAADPVVIRTKESA